MTKINLPLITAAALVFGTATGSTAFATQPGVGYGKTIGALASATQGLATTPDEVRRQGGFATAGAVRWTKAPEAHTKVGAVAF